MGDVRYLLMHRKVLTEAARHYHDSLMALPRDHQSWKYIKNRGISEEVVKKAMIGYSHGQGLYENLTEKGYQHSVIFSKNLAKMMKTGDLQYVADFFGKGRLVFPCLKDNRVVGMTSRICYETDNPAIPRYKMLGKSSYQFYSPDFIVPTGKLVIVEGPIDVLVLLSRDIPAVCFLGTSGFKPEYKEDLLKASTMYCMPDAEDNPQSRAANFTMYCEIKEWTRTTPVVLEIPRNGEEKIDPADLFRPMNRHAAQGLLDSLVAKSKYLDETPEWASYQRRLREDQRKKELREQTLKEGDKLEKFPIIPALEALGVEVFESYGSRPTCYCFNPEHVDSQPSVHIYENTQTFHCFGCNAGHDAIDAVRMVRGMNFNDAIDWLKESLYEDEESSS